MKSNNIIGDSVIEFYQVDLEDRNTCQSAKPNSKECWWKQKLGSRRPVRLLLNLIILDNVESYGWVSHKLTKVAQINAYFFYWLSEINSRQFADT